MSNHFNPTYHIPVLLDECIEGLNINPDGVYADLTFGGGSHSAAILNKLSDKGRLFAFDKDKDALNNAIDDERFCLINDDYANITKQLRLYRVMQLDGVLADLGISSHQIDTSQRGFSFRTDAPLDLRMDTSGSFTAADIINSYEEQDLAEMFFNYAQISNARKLAKTLCRHREQQPIVTTGDLCGILRQLTAKNTENKYFAKVFQALRIEVNHELDSLNAMLEQIPSLLAPKGRLVVISYHSLEDKAVKNLIRSGNVKGELEKDFYGNVNTPFDIITKKPIVPTTQEQTMNPRSRSAKLRIAEKRQ
ncbi:MAG: 16S rRNA (cytosine(1402)-N(4))-methyltransferase RsmH [Bacteroidales bacterium]|nr:16S rRNA (cytosine(1402)-N(4))-methyltransferase RsmH [Bacteroidales bacterium]